MTDDNESLRAEVERLRLLADGHSACAAGLAEELATVRATLAAKAEECERLGRWLDRSITEEDALRHALVVIASAAVDAPNCYERDMVLRGEDGSRRTARVTVQWTDGESVHALLATARGALVRVAGERDTFESALEAAEREHHDCGMALEMLRRELAEARATTARMLAAVEAEAASLDASVDDALACGDPDADDDLAATVESARGEAEVAARILAALRALGGGR